MMARDGERYLLCRPRGGLNDTLSRIQICWRYAERTGRHLVIDASRSVLHGAFGDFFTLTPSVGNVTVNPDSEMLSWLDGLDCRPAVLAGRLTSYDVRFVRGIGFTDAESSVPTRFATRSVGPDTPDFPEPLLVYDDSGGGKASFRLLHKVRFADSLASEFQALLREIGTDYMAVHVRNTDYQTDYRRLFARIRRRVRGRKVLVCSDDPTIATYAETALGVRVLVPDGYRLSTHPTGAMHLPSSYPSRVERERVAYLALRDLVLLANASRLYAAPIERKGEVLRQSGRIQYRSVPQGMMSGFSLLAQHLCTRKDLLDALLRVPVGERRLPDPDAAVTVVGLPFRMRQQLRRWIRG